MCVARASVAVVVVAGSVSAAGADVVLRESFEAPVVADYRLYAPGEVLDTGKNLWQVSGGGVDLFNGAARGEADSYHGAQAVDLAGSPGAGIIQTSFVPVESFRHQLTFWYSRNNNIGGGVASATVELTDALGTLVSRTVTHSSAERPFGEFVQFVADVVPRKGPVTVRFTSLDAGFAGIVIDDITVEALGPACTADFNGDGSVNSQDFFDFLAAFFEQRPEADYDGSGAVDSQDFFDFLTDFFAGC